jgi:hypothetical protein
MIRCARCGDLFDPTKQAAWCRGRGHVIRHHPTVRVNMPKFKTADPEPPKPKREPFQSDFRLIWNDDL